MQPDSSALDRAPILLFWEVTRACPLACIHCRASALPSPLPGQLTLQEGIQLLEQAAEFDPPPLLVLTGGDPLERGDLPELLRHARTLGLRVSVAPAVTDKLTGETFRALRRAGVVSVSLSLDGATAATHDGIRGQPGTWQRTLHALDAAREAGLRVQVNTVVLRRNVQQLARILALARKGGASAWEVFFLVRTGRAIDIEEVEPWAYEQVCHFLYDASGYGMAVRTTEGPQFRRVALQRQEGKEPPHRDTPLYRALRRDLVEECGELGPPLVRIIPTRDGRGIVFVAHDGSIHPSGFLALPCGNVRTTRLTEAYLKDEMMCALRNDSRLLGRCSSCPYRGICGGSRARAYAVYRDPFAEDPACPYVPG